MVEANATPIFVDIELDTFNMSPQAVEAAITPRSRAIIPVLDVIASEDADVAIRKVDIVRQSSPVAEQYNLTNIPRLLVYSPAGKLIHTVNGANEPELRNAIDAAKHL